MTCDVAVLRTIGPVTKNVRPKDWLYDSEGGIEPGPKAWASNGGKARGVAVNRAKKGHLVVAVVRGTLPGVTEGFVGKKEPDCVNRDSVVNPNTRGRGLCYRPQFNPGWKAKFSLVVLDADVLPVESVKEILDYAGFRIGIGDHRPKFGKFMVTKFVARK